MDPCALYAEGNPGIHVDRIHCRNGTGRRVNGIDAQVRSGAVTQQPPDAGTELTACRVMHLADSRPGGAFLGGTHMHADGKIHIIQDTALQNLQRAGA